MVLLGPARPGGAGASVGTPDRRPVAIVGCLALGLVLAGGVGGLPFFGTILMAALGLAAALGLTALARAKIGGQTGDILGAAQQLTEGAALCALAASLT